jgi:hypothetical protein
VAEDSTRYISHLESLSQYVSQPPDKYDVSVLYNVPTVAGMYLVTDLEYAVLFI